MSNMPLVVEMLSKALDQRDLLISRETSDCCLQDSAHARLVLSDEALVIHETEETHDELTIHSVRHASVARNRVAEVLDVECALETGGEETAEWRYQGCEGRQYDDVELNRRDYHGLRKEVPAVWNEWQEVGVRNEDWVRVTLETGENVRSEVVNRANEVLRSHEDVGEEEAQENGTDPCANKSCELVSMYAKIKTSKPLLHTFDSFLGAELDQLCPAKSNSANVCKDIIDDDQADGQEEPDHAFEDVVHDEMCLDHNQVEGHMSPGILCELEFVVAFLQRANEEYEACVMNVSAALATLAGSRTQNVEHEADEPVVCRKWE